MKEAMKDALSPKSSQAVSVLDRAFDGRLAAYASAAVATAAGLGAFDMAAAQGAVVYYSGPKNITVTAPSLAGVYIDFDTLTAAVGTNSNVVPGWDFSVGVYNFNDVNNTVTYGKGLVVAHPVTTDVDVANSPNSRYDAKLDDGVTVGPGSLWTPTNPSNLTYLAYTQLDGEGQLGDWNGVVTGKYVGVRFVDAEGDTRYGWVRLNVQPAGSGADGTADYTFTVVDYAYDVTGDAILTGAVPEPGMASMGLGALALGVLRRPRKSV